MSKVLTIMGINYSKKTFFSFLFLLFLSLSLVSAFNFPQEDSSLTIFQGNLTNLSQLADVNIPSPSNSEVLTYDTAMGKWISSPVGAVEDTNETTRFNALTNTDCSLGYLAIGVQNNGTVLCALDNTGTTDLTNVLRNNSLNSTQFEIAGANITIKETWLNSLFVSISSIVSLVGNWSLDKPNYYTKSDIDSNVSIWNSTYNSTYDSYNNTGLIKDWNATINASGYVKDWNVTGYIKDWTLTETDPHFTGNISTLLRNNSLNSTQFEIAGTNITIKESWLNNLFSLVSNLANYFTKTEVLNYLTNGTNLNKTYADILYAPISVTGDNSSWNETYANTKYILLSNTTTNLNVVNVTSTGNISISQGNRECYNAGCTVYKYYNGTCLIEVGLTSTQETC